MQYLLLFSDQVKSAFIYFLLGSASLFFSVCASVYLPRTLFFKFYTGGKSHQPYRFIENYPPQARIRPNETRKAKGMWIVFKKVFACYYLSLTKPMILSQQ